MQLQDPINLVEALFGAPPLPLLEFAGRFAFVVGAALSVFFCGQFTFRLGKAWGLGRSWQIWNGRAFLSAGLTFALITLFGWIGSSIVLVEGAQTFESLKELMIFLCIVLFGYPALIVVAPDYMLSDLIEGVPPAYVWDYVHGYVCSLPFHWMACQFFGRNPDFRRARTWAWYALFVLQFMLFYNVYWGFICSRQVPTDISYRVISPALASTMAITWLMAPFAMLGALPLARRFGMFWAEIPGHVKVQALGSETIRWESGPRQAATSPAAAGIENLSGVPLRVVLGLSFVAVVLTVSGAVAHLALRSGEEAANKLALRLHQEISDSIDIRLDDYLEHASGLPEDERLPGMSRLLASLPIAASGRAFVLDPQGQVLAASKPEGAKETVIATALQSLGHQAPSLTALPSAKEFRFDVTTARPLSRETWLARAAVYSDKAGQVQWLAVTAMPESYYLADLRAGNSQTAMLCTVALSVATLMAGVLAALVAAPMRRITAAAESMAAGDLTQRVAGSRLAEMGALVDAFNRMAAQLQNSFRRSQRSEETMKGIFSASPVALAVFHTESVEPTRMDVQKGRQIADVNAAWERTTGHRREDIVGSNSTLLKLWELPQERQDFVDEMFRTGRVAGFEGLLLRADGTAFHGLVSGQDVVVNDERLSIVAVEDVSAQKLANAQLQALNRQLNALLDAAVEVAIISTDPEGRITVFNSGAEKMLGYTAAEIAGSPVLQVHLPDDLVARSHELSLQLGDTIPLEQLYAAQTAGGASSVHNWIFRHRNGSPVQVSMALSAVRDERGIALGYLGIARDITEQLAAQAEMVELNTHLDQSVRERTLALEASKESLEQALDHLRQMQNKLVQAETLAGLGHIVAAVAHGLNTPMSEGGLRKQRLGEYFDTMQSGTELL